MNYTIQAAIIMIMAQFSQRTVSSLPVMEQTQLRRHSSFIIKSKLLLAHRNKSLRQLSSSAQHHDQSEVNHGIRSNKKQRQKIFKESKSTIQQYNIYPPKDLYQPYFPIYYNDVYEVPLPPKHRFPMSKYRKVRERVQESIQGIIQHQYNNINNKIMQTEFIMSPLISQEDLETTHCPRYIQRYFIGDQTKEELRNVGFPWSLEGVNRSLSSTGGTVAAAVSLCLAKREQLKIIQENQSCEGYEEDKALNKKFGALFSAHIAGGTHHAFYDRGEGFSVFSDIAVASNVVLRDFPDIVKRILIIDLDVHQGNGNAVLFQHDPRVFTFSIHCAGNYFSKKENSDLDIELPIDCNDMTYLSTLNHWLKRIKNEGGDFDLIFYQAGVDIIDHDRLGRMNITGNGVKRRNKMIYDWALDMDVPLVISMGGGYPRKDWEPILKAHVEVYVDAFEKVFKT